MTQYPEILKTVSGEAVTTKEQWESQRRGEILVAGRLFYLFFAEGEAFFMRDDEVLLKTSGYGRQSYQILYEQESGRMKLMQASFDYHDGETLVETFSFPSPLAEAVPYWCDREDVKGAYGFSIVAP